MKIFDLTFYELNTLLSVGAQVGIKSEWDLLNIVRRYKIRSGRSLIDFIYACTIYPWILDEIKEIV